MNGAFGQHGIKHGHNLPSLPPFWKTKNTNTKHKKWTNKGHRGFQRLNIRQWRISKCCEQMNEHHDCVSLFPWVTRLEHGDGRLRQNPGNSLHWAGEDRVHKRKYRRLESFPYKEFQRPRESPIKYSNVYWKHMNTCEKST